MWCWLVKFKRFNTDTVANTDTFAVAVAVAIAIAVAVAVTVAVTGAGSIAENRTPDLNPTGGGLTN